MRLQTKQQNNATCMPEMDPTKLPYANYNPTISKTRNSKWQKEWGKVLTNYTLIKLQMKSEKVATI